MGLLPPPPGVLPASSSGTSRRCLCKTQVPQSRSGRPPPAFQATHDPPLPPPAGSHFRQATAELAEVRRAGNGRTPPLASDGGHSRLPRQRPKGHPGLDGAARRARRGTGAAAPPGIVGNAAVAAGGAAGERAGWEKDRASLSGPSDPHPTSALALAENPVEGMWRECSQVFWNRF